jgi:putative oxidoreductase
MDKAFFDTWSPRALGLLRIVVGYLYLQHGTAKLLGFPHQAMFDGLQLASLLGLAGILELLGGALMVVGLFTRAAAFILSGEMAFAYFIGHFGKKGFLLVPQLNGGELAVLYCFVFLFFAAAGAGAWSIDAARARPPSGAGSSHRVGDPRGEGRSEGR